jgi:hypothetical protein
VTTSHRSVGLLISLALIGGTVDHALGQSQPESPTGACFDVIPAQAKSFPTAAILVNRCNGQTWLLVRTQTDQRLQTGGFAYRWRPITIERAEAAVQPARRPVPETPKARAKCFVFDGRQFCE